MGTKTMFSLTPDEVPSLADVSPDSLDDVDNVSRVLFLTPERENVEIALSRSSAKSETDSLFGSEISTTPPDAFELVRSPPELPKPLLAKTPDSSSKENSFHETLPSRSLVKIFKVFESSHRNGSPIAESPANSTADSGATEVTEVTSNRDQVIKKWERKVESLERECATLKEIIQADSESIFQLKAEMESLRETDRKSQPPEDPAMSLVRQERDTLLQKEQQYIQKLKKLSAELEARTTSLQKTSSPPTCLEQLRLQNSLLASQIIEDDQEAQYVISKLEVQNAELKKEVSELQRKLASTQCSITTPEPYPKEPGLKPLEAKLDALVERIDRIESHQSFASPAASARSGASTGVLPMRIRYNVDTPGGNSLLDEDNLVAALDTDVEVALDGTIIPSDSTVFEKENIAPLPQSESRTLANTPVATGSVDRCGAFCNCFNSSTSKEENM